MLELVNERSEQPSHLADTGTPRKLGALGAVELDLKNVRRAAKLLSDRSNVVGRALYQRLVGIVSYGSHFDRALR